MPSSVNASAPGWAAIETAVEAVAEDPQLGFIDTSHGRVQFLQVVGITDDELAQMKASSTAEVLAELGASSPLLVTDITR